MKTFNLSLILFLLLSITDTHAQNSEKSLDDLGRLAISVWVPDQKNLTEEAKRNLENKLLHIATSNGLSGSRGSSKFIVTANMSVLNKNITPTAPPMQAYTLELTFVIGDGLEGKSFSSYSTTVKGVGLTETKAINSALKNIRSNSAQFKDFIAQGKKRIIEYYNAHCDFIIKEAQVLATQNKGEEAIYKLTGVPEVCKDCYNKCLDAIAPIYQQHIDRSCKMKLNEAKAVWAANQSMEAANRIGDILGSIEPGSSCFGEISALVSNISKRIKEVDGREWKYILKDQVQNSEKIAAYRAIGVAYGNGQPKTMTYNVRGWW